MANHASAKKRIRQTLKRTAANRHVRSTVRTFIKQPEVYVGIHVGLQWGVALRAIGTISAYPGPSLPLRVKFVISL